MNARWRTGSISADITRWALLKIGHGAFGDSDDFAAINRPRIDTKQDVSRAINVGIGQTDHLLNQLFSIMLPKRVTNEQLRGRHRRFD